MAEFIGSRISLISKRDIRYVGTLHEISSENSTVALEQVTSYGTEGRRPEDEVPPSDNIYEYIVFRGSDVKDLRIEEPPKENKPRKPPQVPDDPAILGSARRPTSSAPTSQEPLPQPLVQQQNNQQQPTQDSAQQNSQQRPPPQQFQQPPYPYYYPPPPNQRFGPQGFPPGPGYPGMPYGGGGPGWYPPPGHGFPSMPPGQFHPQMPIGPPGPQQNQRLQQPQQTAPSEPARAESSISASKPQSPKPVATVKLPSSSTTPNPQVELQNAPPPPTASKPDIAAALAPPAPTAVQDAVASSKAIPTGPKSGRIIPAVPLSSPSTKAPIPVNGAAPVNMNTATGSGPTQPISSKSVPPVTKSIEETNRDARAAVASAMAKLPLAPGQKKPVENRGVVDNLTSKVNEMRTSDNVRILRQPGTSSHAPTNRGAGRGNNRGGRNHSSQQSNKIEVPTTDYDFESANAKFNKEDMVKEAIASGSPIGTEMPGEALPANGFPGSATNGQRKRSEPNVVTAKGIGYNKSSSFFDNISSESKDRNEDSGNRLGGREFRNEERQKNLETFGQGSVDNGYRGGYGRGRARGRGFGRGGPRGGFAPRAGGGRGGMRGGRGAIASEG